ncbi:MAG: (2Fe-2S)-binding protein [Acidobacteria bacterium]|nr:(2Fe-2S)-binding protein [Acidobacteriota bacterium]
MLDAEAHLAIELRVNGSNRRIEADRETNLLSALRDYLGLTGAKYGCGEGQCGACTVLVEGRAVRACVTPLRAVEGKRITTIEGLEVDGRLHPMQEAFLEAGAMQCAYCTSGMILSAIALVEKIPHPSQADIVRGMDGNICRCGTYPRIVQAIQLAASRQTRGAAK